MVGGCELIHGSLQDRFKCPGWPAGRRLIPRIGTGSFHSKSSYPLTYRQTVIWTQKTVQKDLEEGHLDGDDDETCGWWSDTAQLQKMLDV